MLFFTTKMHILRSYQLKPVCENFAPSEIDALKTLEALDLNIDDYSIG